MLIESTFMIKFHKFLIFIFGLQLMLSSCGAYCGYPGSNTYYLQLDSATEYFQSVRYSGTTKVFTYNSNKIVWPFSSAKSQVEMYITTNYRTDTIIYKTPNSLVYENGTCQDDFYTNYAEPQIIYHTFNSINFSIKYEGGGGPNESDRIYTYVLK